MRAPLLLFRVVARQRGGLGALRLLGLHAGWRVVAQIQSATLAAAGGEDREQYASEEKEAHKILMLAPMNDTEFEAIADAALARIEAALEACGADVLADRKDGGVLEIELPDDAKLIVNQHRAAREMWVAAPEGGFHFHWDGHVWRDRRGGEELFAALSRLLSAHCGAPVELRP